MDKSKNLPAEVGTGMFLDRERFEFGMKSAEILAKSTLLPALFKDNTANCMILLNLADRLRLDPFLVAQNLYIISDKPAIEAKLAIALINSGGKFSQLNYRIDGSGDDMVCTAYAQNLKTGEMCEQAVSIKQAKAEGWMSKSGSKWKTLPELMLKYRSAMFFGRVFCPESLLGLYTKDEVMDMEPIAIKGVVQDGFDKKAPEADGSEKVMETSQLPTEQILLLGKIYKENPVALKTAVKQVGIEKVKTLEEFDKVMVEYDAIVGIGA